MGATPPYQKGSALEIEVRERFGILPNFFRLSPEIPEITANLWEFAQAAYLDNPLPSLFKERLFVYLSRFCEVRYSIARHVGFLVGLGRPAGNAQAPVQTVEEVVQLLRRPLPRGEQLKRFLSVAQSLAPLRELPDAASDLEEPFFAIASHVFLQTSEAPACFQALRALLDAVRLQYLILLLLFARSAHYWTKVHPELVFEEDIEQLLGTHQDLAECVLHDPEALISNVIENATVARRESEELLHMAAQARRMLAYEWDAATDKIVRSEGVKQILGEDEKTRTTGQQILSMIPPGDRERLRAAIAQLSPEKPHLQIRYRMVRSDGNVIWVDRTSRAYFDEHGKMLRIVGTIADITDRVRTEEALQESQRELLLVYRNASDCIFRVAVESHDRYRFLSANPAFLKATGLAEDQVVGKLVQEVIPEPSLTMVLRKYEEAIRDKKTVRWEENSEYPAGRKVGEVAVAPVFDETGRCTHLLGDVHDVTDLKGMSRKLIEAQEQERSRIARELHDDINQRLALLSVEIQQVRKVSPITYGELRSRMDELGKRTSEISAVVQSLSHELHSSRLEYLGLVSAMKGFCKEFGDKHKVEIDFSNEGIPSGIPPEISLCLFRIMQEGLQNALKHSGVKFFEVKLHGSPAEIRLTVRDSGVGYEPELAKDTPGLGLVSMRERVRLAKGTISVTSKPQSGTEINARVPLEAGAQREQGKLAGGLKESDLAF
jgi:PAS domain S-box-containing protein